jgi:hypothetical protein
VSPLWCGRCERIVDDVLFLLLCARSEQCGSAVYENEIKKVGTTSLASTSLSLEHRSVTHIVFSSYKLRGYPIRSVRILRITLKIYIPCRNKK